MAFAADRLAEFRLALMLLTRLPAGRIDDAPPLARCGWAFPLVGLIVGGIGAAVFLTARGIALPPAMAAILTVAALIAVTGGLHEDGLADCADSLGARDREKRLAIMRDSRIGTYGVLALGLVTALRCTGLAVLDAQAGLALLALAAASRACIVPVMLWLPPARSDGMGHLAAGEGASRGVVLAGLAIGALALALPCKAGLIVAGVMALATAMIMRAAMARIGGQTGDVLGATQQVTEACGWIVLSAGAA